MPESWQAGGPLGRFAEVEELGGDVGANGGFERDDVADAVADGGELQLAQSTAGSPVRLCWS